MEKNYPAFRTLRADEIDVRIGATKATNDRKDVESITLLLYKSARCDQNILDETVGPMNWQRHHSRDNANCTIAIWDEDKKQWVEKEDTGKESNTEKEKGLASDSFKRAGFNWGIGRELYTPPFIRLYKKNGQFTTYGGKCYDNFSVREIAYNERREIIKLIIYNEKLKKDVFSWKASADRALLPDKDVPEEQATVTTSDKVPPVAFNAGKEISKFCHDMKITMDTFKATRGELIGAGIIKDIAAADLKEEDCNVLLAAISGRLKGDAE